MLGNRRCCWTCSQSTLKPSPERTLVADLMQGYSASQAQARAVLQISGSVHNWQSRSALLPSSRDGRHRSNSGFAFRVDQDRISRWRHHLYAMLVASEVVCNIPVVQAR